MFYRMASFYIWTLWFIAGLLVLFILFHKWLIAFLKMRFWGCWWRFILFFSCYTPFKTSCNLSRKCENGALFSPIGAKSSALTASMSLFLASILDYAFFCKTLAASPVRIKWWNSESYLNATLPRQFKPLYMCFFSILQLKSDACKTTEGWERLIYVHIICIKSSFFKDK